jgi:hypothetical protein
MKLEVLAERAMITLMSCVIFAAGSFLAVSLPLKLWRPAVRADDCAVLNQSNVPAPDGKHEAIISHEACALGFGVGGEYVRVLVGTAGQVDSTNGREAFIAYFQPDVVWSNPNELTITVKNVSWIGTSLHKAGDVSIVYRVAEQLSQENIEKERAEWEARALKALRPVAPGQPDSAKNWPTRPNKNRTNGSGGGSKTTCKPGCAKNLQLTSAMPSHTRLIHRRERRSACG